MAFKYTLKYGTHFNLALPHLVDYSNFQVSFRRANSALLDRLSFGWHDGNDI